MHYKPPLVRGLHLLIAGTLIKLHVLAIAFRLYRSPMKVKKVLKELEYLRRQTMGDFPLNKLFRVSGRYYWDMHAPGWPSKAFTHYNEGEMNRIIPFRKRSDYLNSMILAITTKCPLNCIHCYEADAINRHESLSLDDLKEIVSKFQKNGKGVTQVQFSGGEPLSRFPTVIHLLKSAGKQTDFWLVTSGFGLTGEKAMALKKAGLKGVAISLDHYEPNPHNAFRGSDESFNWVMKAVENAHNARLVVILSLCATRQFVTDENIQQYALFAKKLGAAFILIVEAREVGGFAQISLKERMFEKSSHLRDRLKGGVLRDSLKDSPLMDSLKDSPLGDSLKGEGSIEDRSPSVTLTEDQHKILDDFFIQMNYDPEFRDMPAVSYHGYHQRRIGCFGGGDRYFYIDTEGDIHVCPFSRKKKGNVLELSVPECINILKKEGCDMFKHAPL